MVKRGDALFGFAIAVLIVSIILLLVPIPIAIVAYVLITAFVLGFVFAIASLFPFKHHKQESDKVETIRKLITQAEEHINNDIQKSVDIYKGIKSHYSGLPNHEKSQVLHEIMRLYLKLLESLHLKH